MAKTIRIAFYGKGGIGKSTIATNVAAAFAELGKKVLFIGCDPKGDSTKSLVHKRIPSVLGCLLEGESALTREQIVHEGFNKIACIETGGPEAGVGCAGLGITTTIDEIQRLGLFDEKWDVQIYDVLGDVVCGGFSVPMRKALIDRVFVVTSEEYMSLYACNNLLKSIAHFSKNRAAFLGGVIYNPKRVEYGQERISAFASSTKSPLIMTIPYLSEVQEAEWHQKTVIEYNKASEASGIFMKLAGEIMLSEACSVPEPLSDEGLYDIGKLK